MGLEVFDAFACHLYGQRPDGWPDATWGFGSASELAGRYRAVLDDLGLADRPLMFTEFGGPSKDFGGDQQKRARYYGMMTETLSKIGPCAPFKWEDAGVPGFGMVGTPALAAVSAVAKELRKAPEIPTSVPQTGEIPMANTIEEYLAANPGDDWTGIVETPALVDGKLQTVRECYLGDGTVLREVFSKKTGKHEVWPVGPKA